MILRSQKILFIIQSMVIKLLVKVISETKLDSQSGNRSSFVSEMTYLTLNLVIGHLKERQPVLFRLLSSCRISWCHLRNCKGINQISQTYLPTHILIYPTKKIAPTFYVIPRFTGTEHCTIT